MITRPLFHSICCLLLLLSCGGIASKQTQQQKDDMLSGKEIKTDTITYDIINFKTMRSKEEYKVIKRFDIENYKKKRDTDINFTDRDGMLVRQWSGEDELDGEYYIDERHYPNSPYVYYSEYDTKGRIKKFITNFYSLIVGEITYYDTSGNIIKEVDEDAEVLHKFSLEQLIQKFTIEFKVDIEDTRYCNSVSRYYSEQLGKPIYVLRILRNTIGAYTGYVVDGNNGKTLFSVERFMNDKMGSIEDNYLEKLNKK